MSTALDLFAGAGGWDLAARKLGIFSFGVENMKEALATREANGLETVFEDVWDGLFDGSLVPEYEVLIASPPCQTFSTAGKGAGRKALDDVLTLVGAIRDMHSRGESFDPSYLKTYAKQLGDDRTALVLTPLLYALRDEPTYIAWEQVPPVLPVWQACAEVLRDAGYSVWAGNLQAEQYGVPQTRKRAFLMARRDGVEVKPPVPTYSKYYPRTPEKLDVGMQKWVSMAEALSFGLSERPSPTVTGGGVETGGAEPIAKLNRYTERPDWTHRRPATTVVGSFRPDVIAAPGYRTAGGPSRQNAPDSVRVSVEEAAALQSFPTQSFEQPFIFCGAKSKQYLQVGNAVPPKLAEAVLSALIGGNK